MPTKTTIAYRCPHCGAGVLSIVDILALSADMVKLKCSCGQSAMTLLQSNPGKIALSVPCTFCTQPHSFTVSASLLGNKDLLTLDCPYAGMPICFFGEMNRVKAALAENELELLKHLQDEDVPQLQKLHKDASKNAADYLDPTVLQSIFFVLEELDMENKIHCRCQGRNKQGLYEAAVQDDGVKISCKGCGASRLIAADSSLATQAFLECDELFLE